MSRIGKKQYALSAKVSAELKEGQVIVIGPKGTLEFPLDPAFGLRFEDSLVGIEITAVNSKRKDIKALFGLYGALLGNAVKGVSDGFSKKLNLVGVGYKAQIQGDKLILAIGYSHPVEFIIPSFLKVECPDQTTIVIHGMSKYEVGQFAANVRVVRPPEPYKGKGILYEGEKVRRKAGKSGKK